MKGGEIRESHSQPFKAKKTILGYRVLSQVHLDELRQPYRCGCPKCLDRDGLELIEVLGVEGKSYFTLVDWFSGKSRQGKK